MYNMHVYLLYAPHRETVNALHPAANRYRCNVHIISVQVYTRDRYTLYVIYNNIIILYVHYHYVQLRCIYYILYYYTTYTYRFRGPRDELLTITAVVVVQQYYIIYTYIYT